jgi:hypothetical protein
MSGDQVTVIVGLILAFVVLLALSKTRWAR